MSIKEALIFSKARMEVGQNKKIGKSIVAKHIPSLLGRTYQDISVCVKFHILNV